MAFVLSSPAFRDGQAIPLRHTCEGEDLSPPLEWSGAPPGSQSFVLIIEDPDAPSGIFRHWGLFNVAATRDRLPEGVGTARDQGAGDQGVNDFGARHYNGPCPPKGHGRHHYHFRLAALNTARLEMPAKAKVADIWEAAKPHIIAQADLVGTFERR